MKKFFIEVKEIVLAVVDGFTENNIMKLSASLAYYTILSIAPLLIVVISVVSLIYSRSAFENQVYETLVDSMGEGPATAIQNFIINASVGGKDTLAAIIGAGTLMFTSTILFADIQDSINRIWRIRANPKKGWLKFIINRLLSFSLIISLGFIMLASLMINAIVLSFSSYLYEYIPGFDSTRTYMVVLINFSITFIVGVTIFFIIFKLLPDAKTPFKGALFGAVFTTVFFTIGEYLIGIYLREFQPGVNYGSASSIVIILVWMYYTATILYTGAQFTKVITDRYYGGIKPSKIAVKVVTTIDDEEVL